MIKKIGRKMSRGKITLNKTFAKALIINIAFILVYNLMFYPRFHSDLDILMQSGVYGISGINSSYILYSNVLLGKMFTILMKIIPNVAWYIIFHYLMCLVALVIFVYVILKRNEKFFGTFISIIFVAFIGYECYIEPNYMKTAVVLSVSAAYYFVYVCESRIRYGVPIVVALATMSSMICMSVFVISIIISFIIVFLSCFLKKSEFMWKKNMVITLSVICVLSLGLYFFDCFMYDWSGKNNALSYRNVLEKQLGYGSSSFSEELMEKLGVDSSKYNALNQGDIIVTDDEHYNIIQQYSDSSITFTKENIINFFRIIPIKVFETGMIYFLIFLSVVCCIVKKRKSVTCVAIALLVEYFVFYMLNACQYKWVSFIIILPLSLQLLLEIKDITTEEKVNYSVYAVLFAIVLYSNFSGTMVTSIREEKTTTIFNDTLDSECLLIDMVDYLKLHSVYEVYDITYIPHDVYLINVGYSLMNEFDACTKLPPPSQGKTYHWLYNPNNYSVDNLFLFE